MWLCFYIDNHFDRFFSNTNKMMVYIYVFNFGIFNLTYRKNEHDFACIY